MPYIKVQDGTSLFVTDWGTGSPVVFTHACKLGAEGIVSKKIDAPYRSGPHSAWIKIRKPTSIAVQRERSENWNK